ncbi:hypothetical protein DPMN_098870 [Dreissena polymorpha]|uniref:Uncharacterized protein n=1 Tax=Dreissena polymorpha TaxID=45954 RepID=A0A9D4LDW1_DREPO|nr:hypothetical protein DPMN_098870 [Dreissena polymorpha]
MLYSDHCVLLRRYECGSSVYRRSYTAMTTYSDIRSSTCAFSRRLKSIRPWWSPRNTYTGNKKHVDLKQETLRMESRNT